MIHGGLVICNSFNICVALFTPQLLCSRPTKNKVVLSQINLLWLYGHQRNSRYHRFMSCSYCNNNKEIGNSRHSTSHSLKLLYHDITTITIQTIPNRQSAFALTITQQTSVTITDN